MTPVSGNSMAAALSVIVTAVLWIAVIAGVVGVVLIGFGLLASMSGGELTFPGGTVYVEEKSALQLSAGLITLAVFAPGVIYICTQLKRILNTLAAGDPFVPENAPRLTRIALAVAAIELARFVAAFVLRAFADNGEMGVNISINLAAWASVAALLVLSQVFREGTRLREEEKMTI
ncbi:MAG: DUF2975 domain-containing protein [Pseudomonadota bacterium]